MRLVRLKELLTPGTSGKGLLDAQPKTETPIMPDDQPLDDEDEVREITDFSRPSIQLIPPEGVGDLNPVDQHIRTRRETMRGNLARWLLVILAGTILLEFLAIFSSPWLGIDSDLLDKVLTAVFGPLIALVGTVIGFYFGGRGNGS